MPRGSRDANEREIVDALRLAGCEVIRLEDKDRAGLLDLLVFVPRFAQSDRLMLLEVKTETGRVRPEQHELMSRWPSVTAVVRTPLEALGAIGLQAQVIRREARRVAQTVK